jgi:archaellum component FlaC
MVHDDDDNGTFDDLTNRDMLRIILKEIADVSRELKEGFDETYKKLDKKIDALSSDVKGLRLEVHQNQTSFIENLEEIDERVKILEAKAA